MGLYKGGFMTGVDFTYTVGLDAKTDTLTKKVNAFRETLAGRPFDIKLDLKGFDTDKATQAFAQLGIEMDKIKTVTADVVTLVDKNGKIYQEAKGYTAQYADELGRMTTAYMKIPTTIGDTAKKTKEYDAILKSTADTLNRTQNVDEKHRQGIEKTADEIKNSISSWKQLAEQYGASSPQAKELETKITGLVSRLKEQEGATKTAANAMQNFSTRMANAIKQTFAYGLAMRAMRMAQGELNKAIQYTIDLNTEMTKIQVLQVEGAKTEVQIDKLADSFNRLAKEMGASTLEVAKGSVEWLRQGKTVEETRELLRSTLMLSKLGNMETADATEKLTSTLNGYKMAASEAVTVVDKLVAVDNVAATSVKELTTALQYSAAIANETGVSFEQLVSYVGTVSETTRQNAESIGQGMKTMLTRMRDIKGGKLDEDKLGINNVEISLRRANIELRDSNDSFRDFGTVLEELAGKWGSLTEVEQAFIAKSVAGIRQVNMFTVLMQNMGRALELQEVQYEAAGLAADRYSIYMESLEAKLAVFKATLQGLYQDAISSGFIGQLIDLGTNILKLIEDAGGLESVIKKVAVAFGLLKVGMLGLNNATKITETFSVIKKIFEYAGLGSKNDKFQYAFLGLSEGLKGINKESKFVESSLKVVSPSLLSTATAAEAAGVGATGASVGFKALATSIWASLGPIAPLLIALGAFVAIGAIVEKAIVTQTEAWDKLVEMQEDQIEINKSLSPATKLKERYDDLSDRISTLDEETDEYKKANEELIDVKNQLVDLFPNIITAYDSEGNAISDVTDQINSQIIALRELAIEKKAQEKAAAEEFLYGTVGETVADPNARGGYAYRTYYGSDTSALETAYANKAEDPQAYLDTLEKYRTSMVSLGPEGARKFVDGLREGLPDVLRESLESYAKGIAQAESDAWLENYWSQRTEWDKKQAEEKRRAEYSGQGLKDTQLENAVSFGYGEELNDYLYSTKIPEALEQMKLFQEALENIRNTEPVSEDTLFRLEALGIVFDKTTQTFTYGEGAQKRVIETTKDLTEVQYELLNKDFELIDVNTELWDTFIQAALEAGNLEEAERLLEEQTKALESANSTVIDKANTLSSAFKEQSTDGQLSADTIYELASAGVLLTDGVNTLTNATYDNAMAELQAQYARTLAKATNVDLLASIQNVNGGLWANAAANLASAQAAGVNVDMQFSLLNAMQGLYSAYNNIGASSSGSSAKQEDPRIKANEELIEQIEDQIELEEDKIDVYKEEIDLIKKAQDEYHDWIDQKKKSLELTKEESDYFKEQQKSLKELADIRKEIALLELDTSEEATAKRLELEAQAAEMEAEIAEDAEERRFDLQMEALDKLKDSFDKMIETQIEGIENVIKSIEDGIDILRDRIEDIRDAIEDIREEGGSGGSGGSGGYNPNPSNPAGSPQEGGYFIGPDGNTYYVNPHEGVLQEPFDPNGTHRNQNSRDYAMDIGSNVAAQDTGILKDAWVGSDYGETMVFVNPKTGVATQYYHLAPGTVAKYKDQVGKMEVDPGEFFAQTGNTGNVGDVAHLGVRLGLFDDKGMTLPGGKTIPGQGFYQDEATNKFYEELIKIIDEQGNIVSVFNGNVKSTSNAFEESSISIQNAAGEVDESATAMANRFIDLGATTAEDMADIIQLTNDGYINWNDSVSNITSSLSDFGYSIGLTGVALANFIDYMRSLQNNDVDETTVIIPKGGRSGGGTGAGGFSRDANYETVFHSGGPVESHHDGNFAGNLQSNEVFAKLLKGEYVSTEGQMNNFLKNVLPKVTLGYQAITKNNQIPSITVNMPINVEGNMDKEVIPDIKKISNNVMEEINRSLILRGYVRPANNTLS